MNDVKAKQNGNTQARFTRGYALHGNFILKIGVAEDGAEFACPNLIQQVVFGYIGTGAHVAGRLGKLPDFLVQRHFCQQGLYAGPDVGNGSFLSKEAAGA